MCRVLMLTNKAQTKAYDGSLIKSERVKTAGHCSSFTLPTRLHVEDLTLDCKFR